MLTWRRHWAAKRGERAGHASAIQEAKPNSNVKNNNTESVIVVNVIVIDIDIVIVFVV